MRLFLDTNTQQAISDYAGAIFEGEGFMRTGRSGASREDVIALQRIFLVATRAHWEFVVSGNSFLEAAASPDPWHLLYAHEVAAHWHDCVLLGPAEFDGSGSERVRALDAGRCGYLSVGDAALIRDALLQECDTFLTIERRLATNAEHLRKMLDLEVLRPPQLWAYLQPHLAGL